MWLPRVAFEREVEVGERQALLTAQVMQLAEAHRLHLHARSQSVDLDARLEMAEQACRL